MEDRKQAREGLKATLVRQPAIAAVDLGASKVTCFIMKADHGGRRLCAVARRARRRDRQSG
jgi:hypothetical protein